MCRGHEAIRVTTMCVAIRAPDQFPNTLPATRRSKNMNKEARCREVYRYRGMTQPVSSGGEWKSSCTCLQSPPLTGRSPSAVRRPPLEPLQGAKALKKGQLRPILSLMPRNEQVGKVPPALREQRSRAGTLAVPGPSSGMKMTRNAPPLQQKTDRR